MGLYQDPEASTSSWTRAGDAVGSLHRRHSSMAESKEPTGNSCASKWRTSSSNSTASPLASFSAVGLYQDPEASNTHVALGQELGMQLVVCIDNLLIWQSPRSPATVIQHDIPANVSGLHNKRGENHCRTDAGPRVSWWS